MFESYLTAMRFLRQIWLHRRLAAIVTLVTAIAGSVAVTQMTEIYRADTRLYVDSASMLNQLLAGVALDTSDMEQEFLRLARRSLLSRPNLERIARETGLEFDALAPEGRERALEELSRSIQVRSESTRDRGQENLFQLAYDHPDPDLALEVVRSVYDVFIESVLGLGRRDTEKMETFLERQIQHYEAQLEQAEQRRKQFRQANSGMLPGEGENYFSMLRAERNRLRDAELTLTRAQRVRDELREQLAALAPDGADAELLAGALLSDGDEAGESRDIRVRRIRELEDRLDSLRLEYTDQHPDVVAVKRQLEQARSRAGPEADLDTAGPAMPGDPGPGTDLLTRRLMGQDLQAELARAQANVASERAAVEEYRQRVQELEASVQTIPEVEAEMARLNRDYNVLRSQFEQLVSRRESARMSRQADLSIDEGVFQVIEPPYVSSVPVAPDRPRLMTMVLGGSLAAGGGLAFVLSLIRPTFGDVGQVRQVTGVHVLGRVGVVRDRGEQRRRWFSIIGYACLLLALLAGYGAIMLWYAL